MKRWIVGLFVFGLSFGAGAAEEKASKTNSEAKTAQQQKMKACNQEAKAQSLKGDERKRFMSTCLKAGKAA